MKNWTITRAELESNKDEAKAEKINNTVKVKSNCKKQLKNASVN